MRAWMFHETRGFFGRLGHCAPYAAGHMGMHEGYDGGAPGDVVGGSKACA